MTSKSISAFLKTYGLPCCTIMVIILMGALHFWALPKIYKVEQLTSPGTISTVLLPDFEPKSAVTFIHINYQPSQQTRFQFLSQKCLKRITLNQRIIPFDKEQSCNDTLGLTVDLAPYLRQGQNLLVIEADSPGWLQVGPLLFDHDRWRRTDWLALCLTGFACAFLVLLVHRYTGEMGSGCILAAGFLIYMYWFSHTTFMQYAMDMPSHLEYIAFIANHGYWPAFYAGREYYHPPLYYSIEAVILLITHWLGSFDTVSALRLFSLMCFMVFLVFATLMLWRLIRCKPAYYAALLLMVFYTSGIMSAARLDSHLLFYTWYAGCMYFILRWVEERRDRHLGLALILLGLAVATRSNADVLFPLLGLAVIYQWRKHGWPIVSLHSAVLWIGLIAVVAGVSINYGRSQGIIFIPKTLAVSNSPGNFLLLDLKAYLAKPFWSAWRDDSGRQYFWNSMLKTSLFGEFSWYQEWLAQMLSCLLLALILYTAGSALMYWQHISKQREWWFSMAMLLPPVAALMVYRWGHPYACSQDFRYIYPALIGFCGAFGIAIERHRERRRYVLAGSGMVLAAVFNACSVLFFLAQ